MVIFSWNGSQYRTNSDATLVERNDGRLGWNRTGSMAVRLAALKALKTK